MTHDHPRCFATALGRGFAGVFGLDALILLKDSAPRSARHPPFGRAIALGRIGLVDNATKLRHNGRTLETRVPSASSFGLASGRGFHPPKLRRPWATSRAGARARFGSPLVKS